MTTLKYILAKMFGGEIKIIKDWFNAIMKDELTLSNLLFYTFGAMMYVISRLIVAAAITILLIIVVAWGVFKPFIFVPIYAIFICPMLVVFGIMCVKCHNIVKKEEEAKVEAASTLTKKTHPRKRQKSC